jgi:hypothetical protein
MHRSHRNERNTTKESGKGQKKGKGINKHGKEKERRERS